jgi:hypothetical protein
MWNQRIWFWNPEVVNSLFHCRPLKFILSRAESGGFLAQLSRNM